MDPFEALSLCGEIAIAITGFSGVVVVLGERAGSTRSEVDRVRFRLLVSATLTPLALVALAFILDAAMIDRAATWRICSIAYALSVSTTAYLNVRAGARADSGDPEMLVPRFSNVWRGGAVALTGAIIVMLLQLANAISLHAFWPVLVAAWWGIALSLFAFVGLLFPSEPPGDRG